MRKTLYQGAPKQSISRGKHRSSIRRGRGLDDSFCNSDFRDRPVSNCANSIPALGLYAIYLVGGYNNG